MKKGLFSILFIYIFSCNPSNPNGSRDYNQINSIQKGELVIVFNRYSINTEIIERSTESNESFQFWREGFDPPYEDPNLYISIGHGLDQGKKKIQRKELDELDVWFDSQMDYLDWFNLNFEKYYIIYEDEYLMKESLDPNYEFTAYEVKISTGGVE
ncbi:MAG: hypothetical protein NXH89_16220 [Cyclobacteriaceae bacterium]|jgi:hypothetical protein|uniref:hypothetical protein n=1 Tax=uncultured Algoriphagus sp. TaxID=417365 RepID=UPI0010652209|nr:hypothetical protein [uncultured Algoriphagus sp.]MCR9083975.1 hypothetical protein [Cyclobacteriaceae bacterium]